MKLMTTERPFALIAATYTPLNADGSLNLAAITPYAHLLVEQGVDAAFVCGTTGEGMSLSLDERMAVAAQWREVAPAKLDVIVHVGHTALPDAQALAAHAESIGARAIAAIGPTFFHPADGEALVEWCAAVAAAAPRTPWYYYHFPTMHSPRLPMPAFLHLARECIPTFAGIKFTDENLMEFAACLDNAGARHELFFGRDEILLSAMALGARGAVGSTYNLIAPLFRQMIAAFDGGDLRAAREAQARARACIEVLGEFGGLPAGKAAMAMLGVECGPMRQPLRSLTPQQRTILRERIAEGDFLSTRSGTR